MLGIRTEDYYNDKVLDDANLLYKGIDKLADTFWDKNASSLESWQENSYSYYKFATDTVGQCYPQQCFYNDEIEDFEALVKHSNEKETTLELADNYRRENKKV